MDGDASELLNSDALEERTNEQLLVNEHVPSHVATWLLWLCFSVIVVIIDDGTKREEK